MPGKRFRFPAFLLLGALGLSGCEPDQPFAVEVSPRSVRLDAIGDAKQLSAKVTNEKGVELTGATVTWASSDPNVATVDDAGKVTAVNNGTADITATAGPAEGTAKATVVLTPTQVEAVSGAQQTGTVNQQLPQTLTVRVRDRLNNGLPGLAVAFAVSADGGSVSPATATTNNQGEASTTWTLGTKSGNYQVTATLSGGAPSVTFDAKANPGPAAILTRASPEKQYAYQGSKVDTLVAVRVRDQFANPVPSHPVAFATDAGNGTPDSSVAFTDGNGIARTGWTMPSAIDTVELRALANTPGGGPLLGSPMTFTAISHNLRVQSVTPAPVIEGQTATLTGSGFDPTPAGNQVTIDGAAATVTAATASQLTVTVPTYDCKPARPVNLRVTVGTIPASPVTVTVNPPAFTSVPVGQQMIVRDPTAFCFQFPATTSAETYLIGVQSTSENHTNLTGITLTGTPAGPSVTGIQSSLAGSPGIGLGRQGAVRAPLDEARLRRWARHRAVELEQREADRVRLETLRGQPLLRAGAPGAAAALVPPEKVVGDMISGLRVTKGAGCTDYTEITAVVRAKGTNVFILEDAAKPTGEGFTADDFTKFAQQFDEKTYPTLVAEFGAPGDADANSRIVVVMSKEVNRRGSFGFTTSCDLNARTTSPASNEGEFFYTVVPDPNGTINNDTLRLALAREVMPSILAHEPVHVIQFNRRKAAGSGLFAIWLAEGQATLGEEIVGHKVENRTPSAQSPINLNIVLNLDDTLSTDWYSGHIVALSLYFGWDPINQDPRTGRVQQAPHECTWLSSKPDNPGPCVGRLDPYGAPWSFLRWLSDRFGPTYPGGEAGIQMKLIDNTLHGYQLVESVIGKPMDSLLAQWAAMLYADNRVNGLAAELQLPTWDLFDIYYGTAGGFILIPALRLVPAEVSYAGFSSSANVRAGSTYYALLKGFNRPATAVKARDAQGNLLPPYMRYWIVRIE